YNVDVDLGDYLQALIDPVRGRMLSLASLGTMLAPVLHYGFPAEIGAGTYDRSFAVETVDVIPIPNEGDFPGPVEMDLPMTISGVEEIVDNKTYVIAGDYDSLEDYRLQARDGMRPY